ncbi:uncharacterized protein si:ch73-70k4.1 isoform X2 [Myripristis murdjan]|uniref:uncharacterized protein si:ch73-70k4.1 isoform X2 n=1 Tax=Myripristis murdjan TaxID=586833 RepID=UPI0011761000|nr:Fanconi anemia core complex-associated protein 20 isoform X2 [Myripristis murdjan]
MAENFPKSKLKRKKCAEIIQTKSVLKSSQLSPGSGAAAPQTGRSAAPPAAWWDSEQLPASHTLWLLTLSCAVPHLEDQRWAPVPELPHVSPARPDPCKPGDEQWCDLSEEVAPFPEPSSPPTRVSPTLNPLTLSSSFQELPAQAGSAAIAPDAVVLETRSVPLHDKQPCVRSWDTRASLPQPGSDGEERKQSRLIEGQHLAKQRNICGSQAPLQREGENEQEVEDKEEALRSCSRDGADGGGRGGLQSCPMCLLVFPAGFLQHFMARGGRLLSCQSTLTSVMMMMMRKRRMMTMCQTLTSSLYQHFCYNVHLMFKCCKKKKNTYWNLFYH